MQIVREVARWLPAGTDTDTVANWVGQALGYLIVRGDVERGPGRVYRCLPPYLVKPPGDSEVSGLRLHGDPRAEQSILDLLQSFGARLNCATVPAGDMQTAHADPVPDLRVLERNISLAATDLVARAATICEPRGYTVLRPHELGEALPGIEGILCPAERDLRSADEFHAGIWEVYEARNLGEDRWQPEDLWRSGGSQLVRLRHSDDRLGEWGARVFYHGGRGRVLQLEREAASLWQFYLDFGSGNPRIFWWHGSQIWVPRIVPFATLRWLELLAGHRARRSGQRLTLSMSEASAREARGVLAESLGLEAREERPPRERYRRDGRGKRRSP